MIKKIAFSILLLSGMLLLSINASAQQQKTWTTPIAVTKMNGGKIYVSYSYTNKDSIFYKIKSKCAGLKHIYTCFAFKYLDKNNMEHTYFIRDIPLGEKFEKEFKVYASNGMSKIVMPYMLETIVAYVDDSSDKISIIDN
ncbi:hypothetical protein [Pedobacter hartonius]|uniref:Uncharacterized protein n=1 Tax=Pedobacter hartonius TaxID=425514 RepID=A0A1H4H9C0_9SPHI|nr:hypothetical protein [Pedobacter hartonius]SEB18266.1 hypothetical protein SAMN05443550_11484 [Pedobacter hartonius]